MSGVRRGMWDEWCEWCEMILRLPHNKEPRASDNRAQQQLRKQDPAGGASKTNYFTSRYFE